MFSRRTLVSSFIAAISLAAPNVLVVSSIESITAPGALAQEQQQFGPGANGNRAKRDNIDARLRRQHKKIDAALKSGQLNEQQANQLQMDVANIENKVKTERQANNGDLNPQQHTTIENLLNQTLNQIDTAIGVSTKVPAGANPLGANWQPGPDGAQDPDALKRKMKAQERRALRQQKQAGMQAIEQQQLQYEKDMVNTLGNQKTVIEKDKQQLENARNNSGAN